MDSELQKSFSLEEDDDDIEILEYYSGLVVPFYMF